MEHTLTKKVENEVQNELKITHYVSQKLANEPLFLLIINSVTSVLEAFHYSKNFRNSRPEVFCKKDVLVKFAKFTENTCARVYFKKKLHPSGLFKIVNTLPKLFIRKGPLAQVFFCEFWEVFKNTRFYRRPPVAFSRTSEQHFYVTASIILFSLTASSFFKHFYNIFLNSILLIFFILPFSCFMKKLITAA